MNKLYHTSLRLFFSFILFLLCSFQLSAQWYNPEKVNKKAKNSYESAYNLAVKGKYKESIEKINEAITIYPKYVEAYLSRAGIYADLKDYQKSTADFEIAIALDSVFSEYYFLPYSISLAGCGQFENALLSIDKFLSINNLNEQSKKAANYRKNNYLFAIEYKKTHPTSAYTFSPKNIGLGVNSEDHEYYPSTTIDGKEMIFNRRVNGDEDFYESSLINGEWTTATPIKGKINTNYNEGAQTISQDGQCLIFTGCNYPEGAGSCDLYISYKNKNGFWTEAENLGPAINTEFWESNPSLSANKQDLYFSSDRLGGYGGKDIWISHRNNKGNWSKPENLGPIINSKGDETCPFIHSDNQSLFFNSNGHPGYGMADLFISRKSKGKQWQTPENLGYPINTIDDEGSLIVASDGKTCFYASDFGKSENGLDIYSFVIRNDIKAIKTTWVTGKVFDQKTLKGLPSSVELTDINNRDFSTSIQTDEDGNYFISLPEERDYAFNVNRKGYLFYSNSFSLQKNTTDSFFNINIGLNPIEAGAKIILKNIFFEKEKYTITSISFSELDKLYSLLLENPILKFQIEGHTDNSGNKEANILLSQNRAKAVVNYLTAKGISATRLKAMGFGDSKPIDSNETEQGKSNNRRTEIHVLSN